MTLDKFVITKQLTKRPEDYPDAKNQPHVQVALRRKAANKRDGTMQVTLASQYQLACAVLTLPVTAHCPARRAQHTRHWDLAIFVKFAALCMLMLRSALN